MELRPYQQQAKDRIFEEWRAGNSKTLLVLPTGCGKTIVFAKVSEDCVRMGGRVLILAHRGELLEQAADKILKTTGLVCAVEKAESSCLGQWYRIVVGSVQSLMRDKRLAQFDAGYFDTIIIDEAHHALSESYQKILNHFSAARVLGVRVDRSIASVFLLAGSLAGVAGILYGMKYNVFPTMGNIGLKAFVASVVGGLGSVPGAIVGSLLLGVLETFVSGYISSSLRDFFSFALLIVLLLVKPSGLFGVDVQDKA